MKDFGKLYPLAAKYAAITASSCETVKERQVDEFGFPWTERHLQCVWIDNSLRPSALRTVDGEEVSVISPGRWNLERGPDFLDATVVVGRDKRRISGDVELHIRPADWERHRHFSDSRYSRVIAHVAYYPGRIESTSLPPHAIQVCLRDALRLNPAFSFESIDLAAYPFAARIPDTPCSKVTDQMSPEEVGAMLDSAGQERMRVKTVRIAAAVNETGADQAFYEEVLSALGYKDNRVPFRQLARLVPLTGLREIAEAGPTHALAVLAGVSGLLPEKPSPRWDAPVRTYHRELWDAWWKVRSRWENSLMNRKAWRLSGIRPQNHPLRRMAAAAALFSGRPSLPASLPSLRDMSPADWINRTLEVFTGTRLDGFWESRISFAGKPGTDRIGLIGDGRAAAILSNVVLPFIAASGAEAEDIEQVLRALPPEQASSTIRLTAHSLLGRDHNPDIYLTGLRQQGLIQIFQDFCLPDRTGCLACPLPAALKGRLSVNA